MSQRERVQRAKEIARASLGCDPRSDQPSNEMKDVPATRAQEPVKREAVYVLTVGEVAIRLGISMAEVERMIAAGRLRALPTGFTVTVPTSEVVALFDPMSGHQASGRSSAVWVS